MVDAVCHAIFISATENDEAVDGDECTQPPARLSVRWASLITSCVASLLILPAYVSIVAHSQSHR